MTYPPKSYYSSPECKRGDRIALAVLLWLVLAILLAPHIRG